MKSKVALCSTNCPNSDCTSLQFLGLFYLANYLRSYGKNTYDFIYVNKDHKRTFDKFQPDVVLISSSTLYWNYAKEIAAIASKYTKSIIVGGNHISTLPSCLSYPMQTAVIGEGEKTLLDLLESEHKNIKGTAVVNANGNLTLEEPRPLIEPLDNIPFPARDLYSIKKNYWTGMITSRGCVYHCVFCSTTNMWKKVRWHSAEYVLKEIQELNQKYNANRILIYDDIFTANKPRLHIISSALKKENLDIEFQIQSRTNLLTDEICKELKLMNVTHANFGFESNSERILKYLKGNSVTTDDNIRTLKLCKKYGISVNANIVIGSPTETREEILQTLKFIKNNKFDTIWTHPLTPFPDTPLWEYAKQKGLVNDDMDFSKLQLSDFNKNQGVMVSETLSREEFFEIYQMFIKEEYKTIRKHLIKESLYHPKKVLQHMKIKIFGCENIQ